jgi:hypothetical protein
MILHIFIISPKHGTYMIMKKYLLKSTNYEALSLCNFHCPSDTSILLCRPASTLDKRQESYPYKIGKVVDLVIFSYLGLQGENVRKITELNASKNVFNLFCS